MTVSTDPARLDVDLIHEFLAASYWARGIPRSVVERSIRHSLCFGLYDGEQQVGFARVITDYATFAYLADVFVLESHRGCGLAKVLMEAIRSHPDLQGLRRWALVTATPTASMARLASRRSPTPAAEWRSTTRTLTCPRAGKTPAAGTRAFHAPDGTLDTASGALPPRTTWYPTADPKDNKTATNIHENGNIWKKSPPTTRRLPRTEPTALNTVRRLRPPTTPPRSQASMPTVTGVSTK